MKTGGQRLRFMAGVSETNQRKEYLACLSVAGNMPNISCGSTRVKVFLCSVLEWHILVGRD